MTRITVTVPAAADTWPALTRLFTEAVNTNRPLPVEVDAGGDVAQYTGRLAGYSFAEDEGQRATTRLTFEVDPNEPLARILEREQ